MGKRATAPTVRLKPSLRKKLKTLPRREGCSVTNYLEQLIKREIEWQEAADKGK
jgi:predicted transcriptional regulator